jgi:hypothetical protein
MADLQDGAQRGAEALLFEPAADLAVAALHMAQLFQVLGQLPPVQATQDGSSPDAVDHEGHADNFRQE